MLDTREHIINLVKSKIISEKLSVLQKKDREVIILKVRKNSTKKEISEAVNLMFNKQPFSVNILNVKGKRKMIRRREIFMSDWKKAYVTFYNKDTINN